MKKQVSLLNFFNKAPSSNPSTNSQRSDLIRKLDDLKAEDKQSAPSSSQESRKENNMNNDNFEPDVPTPQKIYQRLKKVKILDEEEEALFGNGNNQSEKDTPIATNVDNGTKITALAQFKSAAKARQNSFIVEDEPPKKSTAKKSNTTTPVKDGSQEDTKSAKKKTTGKKSITPSATPAKDDDVLIDIEKDEGNVIDYNDFSDKTPDWARKENCRDAKGRSPDHPEYDPTTLYIPPGALSKMTPTMVQYWEIKSKNFDKILLFKLGKFYELFYDDALICHKELDLNWMGGKMHVGFPEKALEKYGYELVSRGYKVCVVEQTETPKQMEERLKAEKKAGIKSNKLIKREMVQVMSKGTYIDQNDPNHEPRYLLSIRSRGELIGVAFLEIGSNKISLGAFKDDQNYTTFKTLVSQIRPSEVLFETLETDPNLIKIMRNSPNAPVISPVNNPKHWNSIVVNGELEKYYKSRENWPEELKKIFSLEEFSQDIIMACFAGLISYLTAMLIAENVMATARYEIYDPATFAHDRMILDSQALQHLEILEVGYSTKNPFEGSVLSNIDKTVTKFGKRLLRKWICAPLLNVKAINDRLDAVEELEEKNDYREKVRVALGKLPDLERMCGRIYNLSVKKSVNVVLFEEVGVARLREFKKLLESFEYACNILEEMRNGDFKSVLLKRLTTFDDPQSIIEGKSDNMPEIRKLLKEVADFVVWEGAKQEIPVPRPGADPDYDGIKEEIKGIEDEFTAYLKQIQQQLGNKTICYTHTKHRYEIEVPEELVKGSKKPKEFEFSSKKQGKERFVTQKIKDLVEKLEDAEDRLKNALNLFTCFLFSYFHKHHKVWDRFIEGLSQLDCLCSLSLTSFLADGDMCRPEIYPMNDRVFLEVRDMRHPCISMMKSNFVPNDIIIGDVTGDGQNHNVILLTGPNMGGKSTILRQACIAAILAQIGCFVPAKECRLSVVDRIFTRIGASDKLLEGKSTFYIEMEETLNILKYGTMNSLAIVDELGRGTSTFDGVSIAYSVLKHILTDLKCRTLFATHYHVLLDEFRDSPDVSYYHMASKIDHENEKVIFLYKLIQGECSNSFGLNIARITGLPKETMKVAKVKADEFEKNLNIREYTRVNKAFGKSVDLLKDVDQITPSDADDAIEYLEQALQLLQVNE